jgi:hypothetical protein
LDLNINPVRAVLYLQGWQGQFWGCWLGLWRTRFPMSDCQVVDSWLINKSWTIIMKFGAAEQRIPQPESMMSCNFLVDQAPNTLLWDFRKWMDQGILGDSLNKLELESKVPSNTWSLPYNSCRVPPKIHGVVIILVIM